MSWTSDQQQDNSTHAPQSKFEYWMSGTVPLEAISYVKRRTDDIFYENLKVGKFCYVLNSRQMGKSSLRVQTMARLKSEGIVCVSIDITLHGSDETSAEQFYFGFLTQVIEEVKQQTQALSDWDFDRFDEWWMQREKISFVQRWRLFMEEILLVEVVQPIVIFVDEIDSVLKLSFPIDDFFAAIRACYNRRADVPNYDRLTFALLGVCSPQDLIRDDRRTPFNIGQAIELSGFSYEEAIGLAAGLPGGEKMLRAVLNWTGGQPFLTQRVCRLVVEEMPPNPQFWGDMSVEEIVQSRIIRVWESNDEQVHFQTIGDRMMANESITGAMLGIYQRVLTEGSVGMDGNEEQIALRLTGMVVKRGDQLEIANRIYKKIFNVDWVEKKLLELRPYGKALQEWEKADEDARLLLKGSVLQNARSWAKGKQLAAIDHHFIDLSLDVEVQQQLEQKEERIQKLLNQLVALELQEERIQKLLSQSVKLDLDQPGGRMSIESPFYVMRSPAEEEAAWEVMKPGALIRIKAPHEFGKSSLMGRVMAQAEAGGVKTVSINFREIDREFLGTLNGFLKHFCVQVTRKLRVPNRLEDYWDGGLGSKGDCGEYFEDYLLPMMSGGLVLELDDMDVLFEGAGDKAWAIDFLSMLRAWFEKGRTSEKWKKLRLVLVHAKDIDQETLQQAQSPFNVGTEIELGEFNAVQVGDLAVRHGLETSIAPRLMALVGGHPQLVRLGLYAIARGQSLETLGATEAGLYGNHLRRVRSRLEGNPELKLAFQRVLADGAIDQAASAALRSLGVGKLRGNKVEVTCELYRQYFRSVWS